MGENGNGKSKDDDQGEDGGGKSKDDDQGEDGGGKCGAVLLGACVLCPECVARRSIAAACHHQRTITAVMGPCV
jgi:hypothetical protein